MIIKHKLSMDLHNRTAQPRLNMVQCDQNTRAIEISLTTEGTAWIPEGLENVFLRFRKSDGTGGCYDTMPDGAKAWTATDNRITVLVVPQMLTVPGLVEAQLVLTSGNQYLATFSFQIAVEADPSVGTARSEDYVSLLEWAKTELHGMLEQARENGDFAGTCYLPDVDSDGILSWTNDGGLQNPESVNLAELIAEKINGDILQGTMAGDLLMNGHRITGLADPETDDQAVTKGYALTLARQAAPRNLLDNSDFTNPVNQRGVTTVTPEEAAYTIDRWRLDAGNTLTVNNGSITITGGWFAQPIEPKKIDPDKTYTAALYFSDGTVVAETGVFARATQNMYTGFGISSTGVPYAGIIKAVTIQKIALYEGTYTRETLPEYQPKGFAAELKECQRYYYRTGLVTALAFGTSSNSRTGGFVSLITPVEMRIVPSVVANQQGWLRVSGTSYEVNTISVQAKNGNLVTLNVLTNSTSVATGNLAVLINTALTLSADL